MSVRRAIVSTLVTVVGGSALAVLPAPVHADVEPEALAAALDLPTGVSASVTGSVAVTTRAFNDFPSKAPGSSYVVLSNGDADQVMLDAPLAIDDPATVVNEREPDEDALSTDWGADRTPDTARLTLTVDPSTAASCLLLDFAMGTDETIRVLSPAGDRVSVTRRDDPATQYAMNAGRSYFDWPSWGAQPREYSINSIDYWHVPGDRSDVLDGQLETPRLQRWTRLNNVTTRDSARVPLDLSDGADLIDIEVSDGSQDAGEIDSAAFLDNVRLTTAGPGAADPCATGTAAQPTQNYGEGSIKGDRRVGYPLSYDPYPATPEIERHDAAANGWSYPGKTTPVELRFRWYRTKNLCPSGGLYTDDMNAWLPIADADRQSYVPSNLDRGRCLIVLVSAVVDGRPTQTRPLPSEAIDTPVKWYTTLPIDYGVFLEGSTPTVNHDGSPKVGETITASPVATRPLQDSWSYQWYADGSAISGASSSSLVLAASHRGKVITVRTTASRSAFESKSFTSAPTPTVAGNQMESVGTPSIAPQPDAQPPSVGDVLEAVPGPGWPENTAFSYQWRRNGAAINGADSLTFTTGTADAGKQLSVTVTGSKPGFDPVSATTSAITVAGTPMSSVAPTISGTAKVGMKLTADTGTWNPVPIFSYGWYADGVLLASGSSYVVGAGAVGKRIELRVTGTRTGYETTTRSSALTAVVVKGTLTPGTVRIYGTQRVGSTLTASPGSWRPTGVTFKYQWRIGTTWLSGTTRTSIKLPSSARGKRVTVYITGSKAGYTAVKRSAITGTIR